MLYNINNVGLVYDAEKNGGTTALKNITLSIKPKTTVGLLGPSGSGKSSLLYILSGLRKPTSGSVQFNSHEITKMTMDQLAELRKKNFGFIFQQHFLINYMTVIENVLVPLNENSRTLRKKATEILKKLGIEKYASSYPEKLSGGQRQRAAIARALINEPSVIFCDEPTSALDHKSAVEVMDLLKSYSVDSTIILVTHDEGLLDSSVERVYIQDGMIKNIVGGM
jgi:putative ABC transport system ATP-binding protein